MEGVQKGCVEMMHIWVHGGGMQMGCTEGCVESEQRGALRCCSEGYAERVCTKGEC